ncbi:MAG TPA: COX15/CtaA family protein, partial [Candidatus Limnocylindrales bacterium]
MTRFQKLAAATVVTAILLVTIGVIVRVTNSGVSCPNWPGCFEGQFLPSLSDGYQVWLEWIHRTVAVIIGFEVIALAILAVVDLRKQRTLVAATVVAVLLVGFQAWLGRETVRLGNSGESVTAHLASAMALVGLLVWILARSLYPARLSGRGSQRFTLLAALGAGSVYALLLFGSHVTATSQWYVFPDWPLMDGSIFPAVTDANSAHVLHRWVAVIVGVIVAAVFVAALQQRPRSRPIVALATIAAVLFPIQAIVGGLQILTDLSGW